MDGWRKVGGGKWLDRRWAGGEGWRQEVGGEHIVSLFGYHSGIILASSGHQVGTNKVSNRHESGMNHSSFMHQLGIN